ncbi:MAG: D-glycero-beta-D-manno-heptose-7-phosphate kinase [Bacteroidota bacterium]
MSFTETHLKELFRNFHGKKIAVVGDLMVDRYYWGKVHRVSPEAPVPVVEVDTESVRLGGAANVAHNIQALGGEPILIGMIGNDHAGSTLTDILKERNLTTSGIVIDISRPTTMKTRVIAHGQHVVRIDNESKAECPIALQKQMVDAIKSNIRSLHGIILEDYNKGVITREIIHEIVAAAKENNVPVTVDPKFNNFLEYRNVTVFKPNRREAEEALGGKLRTVEDIVRAGRHLLEVLGAQNVLLTRGEEGMSLFEANGEVTHMSTTATNVQDVSGAGDTVISTLTMALVGGATVREAAILANCAGGIVVGEVGIVPVQPAQLIAEALRVSNNQRVS